MSTPRATIISLIGCAVVFAVCHRWGGWPLNALGTLVIGGGWSIIIFAIKSMQDDADKQLAQIRAAVAQSPPILRLAVAMAQPLRSYHLRMPIPILTDTFNDHGLYLVHHLSAVQYQYAQQQVEDWLDQARDLLGLEAEAVPDFRQSLPFLVPTLGDTQEPAQSKDDAVLLVHHCYRMHLLVCAIDTDVLSVEQGQHLLIPFIEQLQARYARWDDYARDLKQAKWTYMRRDLPGLAAQAVHFKDLLNSRLSPWQMTDIQLDCSRAVGSIEPS